MSLQSLEKEKKILERAHQELIPYVNRNKKISNFISLVLIAYGLYLFAEGLAEGGFFLLQLAYTPLLIGTVGEKALNKRLQWKDTHNVEQQMVTFINSLKEVLGNAAKCVNFCTINNYKLSLSILKITIKQRYQELPPKIVGDLLMQALNRFGIQLLPSYTRTEFSIPAQATFRQIHVLKNFFQISLQRALGIHRLKLQMNTLLEKLAHHAIVEKNIKLDNQGFYACEHLISLSEQFFSLKTVLINYGFVEKDDYLILNKNDAFDEETFQRLVIEFNREVKACRSVRKFLSEPIQEKTERRKRDSEEIIEERKRKEKEEEEPKNIRQETVPAIHWSSGAAYPSDQVVKVRGAINKFMLWTLEKKDFGEYENAFDPFKEKSGQQASKALGKAGIKQRPTIGNYGNKQRLFPAHIKIPGPEHGNQGVVLDIEKGPKGETLYITRGFEPNIHKKIK